MHCPACGAKITDVYETRPVLPTRVAHGMHGLPARTGAHPWQQIDDRPVPVGRAVVQPCGCTITMNLARAMTARS